MKQSTKVLIGVVVLVVVALIAWLLLANKVVDQMLGLGQAPVATTSPSTMGTSTPGGHFGGMRGGFAMGSIAVLNDNGFTLSLQDGTTKTVTLSATTTIQNYTSASSTPTTITTDQLSVGEQVLVIGSANADGSITARTVRTGTFPAMSARGGRGPGGQGNGHGSANGGGNVEPQ
jgi:hypothetical protein